MKPTKLAAPYNNSHPSSRCPNRLTRGGAKMGHKFRTVRGKQIKKGVFETVATCESCGGYTTGIEDYTVTAGIFAI